LILSYHSGGENIRDVKHKKHAITRKQKLSQNHKTNNVRNNGIHILNNLIVFVSRVAQPVTPEMLLQQVLMGIRDGTYAEKMKGIPIERLVDHVQDYYNKFKQNPNDTENLKFSMAFADLIYLLDPEYSSESFNNIYNAVTHSWLEFIPKSIKAARPIKSIPGEVMERLAIPLAKPATKIDSTAELPTAKPIATPVVDEFNEKDLETAKYNYRIAELCFVMRDYDTAYLYLSKVLSTPYLNVDSNNLLVQNSILWAENSMMESDFKSALEVLENVDPSGTDPSTAELIYDKLKEATVLHKIAVLEEKCPLNEHAVGVFLRKRIGYKKFLRLTYFIFGNIEFHERLEEIRIFPKKMIYPLLKRDPTPKNEELIVKRHEMHDGLIRNLYDWFWELDIVKHYLTSEIKEELTDKFGEFGSGPVIYFRYVSKGHYANIIISKAVEYVSQDNIQEAKKILFETYEFTGSKKIKGYLDFLRQHEKAKKQDKPKKVTIRKRK
jgi:hypothetical protein